jgi:hypothetical protein
LTGRRSAARFVMQIGDESHLLPEVEIGGHHDDVANKTIKFTAGKAFSFISVYGNYEAKTALDEYARNP